MLAVFLWTPVCKVSSAEVDPLVVKISYGGYGQKEKDRADPRFYSASSINGKVQCLLRHILKAELIS